MSRDWPTFNPATACPKCSHSEVRADWRPEECFDRTAEVPS